MKRKIYALVFMLSLVLPAFNLHGEEITGTSHSFEFGAPIIYTLVPLSPLALGIAAGLIGIFIYWRYFGTRKPAEG